MPTDEAYQAVLHELSKLAGEWRIYRDTINRAINLLNGEVVGFGKQQRSIDRKLDAIRRLQWTRVMIEIVLLLMAIAYIYGVSR